MRRSAFCVALVLIAMLSGCGAGIPMNTGGASASAILLSATAFDFGPLAIGSTSTRTVATVTNTTSAAITLSIAVTGDPDLSIASGSCHDSLAAGASCSLTVTDAPRMPGPQSATLTFGFTGGANGSETVVLSGTALDNNNATVSATSHPLVAAFSIAPSSDATVTVQFGEDMNYGRTTAPVSTPAGGGAVVIYVAGMRANTAYHMRAVVTYTNGTTTTSPDLIFTTGSLPQDLADVQITASTATGQRPQPGVELMDPVVGVSSKPYATDLAGNIIWYYPWSDFQNPLRVNGFHLLPNGHFLAVIGLVANPVLNDNPAPANTVVREVDLLGNTVRQVSIADLNRKLPAIGHSIVLTQFHHDAVILPNGHWLAIAATIKTVNGQAMAGDVVVDLDQNGSPVWVWNEFDHLDTNRRPMGFPDWTHSNALLYMPADGNFLISIRHQSWVLKVNYSNGMGDGSVLWKLGYQGDFSLVGGTSPTDWQYAQHAPSLVGGASAGSFKLVMMDNGNNRILPDGRACGLTGEAPCYSTVPIFDIDEKAMTATIEWRRTLPEIYSSYAGNAEVLANGDVEYDLCDMGPNSGVFELTQDSNQTLVWSLTDRNNNLYRSERLPSMYPGVQW